jgi:hypothetical protein
MVGVGYIHRQPQPHSISAPRSLVVLRIEGQTWSPAADLQLISRKFIRLTYFDIIFSSYFSLILIIFLSNRKPQPLKSQDQNGQHLPPWQWNSSCFSPAKEVRVRRRQSSLSPRGFEQEQPVRHRN